MGFLIDPYRTPTAKLTSTIYPIFVLDGSTAGADLEWGRVNMILPEGESVGVDLVSGELRSIFLSYDIPWEAETVAVAITSGELKVILKTYDFPWEAVKETVEIQSGELKVILIVYSEWPFEGESVSCSIISGTLAP